MVQGEVPKVEIDVLFVGQTGIGKSTIVNMIRRVTDSSKTAAEVSNGVTPCTKQTIAYPVELETGLHCQLWDTRGLDEAVESQDRGFMAKIVDRLRQLAKQQERELRETIRHRTRTATPILMWCIDATKLEVPFHWQQFRKVYVEYCDRKAIPVIVITRMASERIGWEPVCRSQLQQLDLGLGPDTSDVPLLRVRTFRNSFCAEYTEDSNALRDLICRLRRPVDT
ncbi:hypothetical protein JVU11DRAFT_4132 [Chiua virens]|nr:hypothetical protein JVU11DRAFT_4132 [Chiua virens]